MTFVRSPTICAPTGTWRGCVGYTLQEISSLPNSGHSLSVYDSLIYDLTEYSNTAPPLRRTTDSLTQLKYDDKCELILVVCDGNIVGSGSDRPTCVSCLTYSSMHTQQRFWSGRFWNLV
ncbi:hypothetical protein OG21DRAFT_1249851 [Imleria badia]|nr:hypothetical protein OG21DRAFT_1249851 [Imleria badia]